MGVKDFIDMNEIGSTETKAMEKLQLWLGKAPVLKTDPKEHILSFALSTSVVHPSTMFCRHVFCFIKIGLFCLHAM